MERGAGRCELQRETGLHGVGEVDSVIATRSYQMLSLVIIVGIVVDDIEEP